MLHDYIEIPGDTTPVPPELFRGTDKPDEFSDNKDNFYLDLILFHRGDPPEWFRSNIKRRVLLNGVSIITIKH